MVKRKRDLKVEFLDRRLLTNDEADAIRASVAAMRPKVHLVMANWPYCEVRGIRNEAATKVLEALKEMGLRFREL